MKDEFSLEALKDKIYLENTQKYFEEVYSSYLHGNYRSAVVMLWSVVILDLVQKLEILEEVYEDRVAIDILKSIEELKRDNSKSSAWELQMVETISKKTDLIDFSEYVSLQYLQQQRHLSAHPVLEGLTKLYVPNKDTARALIRNALEIVLLKSPVYTDRIVTSILADLSENKMIFNQTGKLKSYVKQKYLERLSPEAKLKIFEIFWKFVMKLDNKECEDNRNVNRKFLTILAQDNLRPIEERIRNKTDFYSEIKNDKKIIRPLIVFLSTAPTTYPLLSEAIKIIIDTRIKESLDLEVVSFFNKNSMKEHFKHLEKLLEEDSKDEDDNVPHGAWLILSKATESQEMQREFTKVLGLKYAKSKSFVGAENAGNNVIRFIDSFEIEAIETMLAKAEANSKTYDRQNAYEDYKVIENRVTELGADFNWSPYPNFRRVTT